jgi:hypothetical protein
VSASEIYRLLYNLNERCHGESMYRYAPPTSEIHKDAFSSIEHSRCKYKHASNNNNMGMSLQLLACCALSKCLLSMCFICVERKRSHNWWCALEYALYQKHCYRVAIAFSTVAVMSLIHSSNRSAASLCPCNTTAAVVLLLLLLASCSCCCKNGSTGS